MILEQDKFNKPSESSNKSFLDTHDTMSFDPSGMGQASHDLNGNHLNWEGLRSKSYIDDPQFEDLLVEDLFDEIDIS